MKQLLVLFSCLIIQMSCAQDTSKVSAETLMDAYYAYRGAAFHKKCEDALIPLSKRTHDYYKKLRTLVLYANKKTLLKEHFTYRYMALVLRTDKTKDELLTMSEQEFMAYAVCNDIIREENSYGMDIKTVDIIDENSATIPLIMNDTLDFSVEFFKENDTWKLDLGYLITISNMTIEYRIFCSRKSEEEYYLMKMEERSGKKIGKEIWKPLSKKGKK